jgi:large subunit ribosomal protein L21
MTKGTNKVLKWFSGTHKQLMEALGISTNKTEEAEITTDYSSQTVSQLKTIAKERGLKGYSSLKKAQLIELLNR